MATLFKGKTTLKNGVNYDVDYEVSASYTGTFSTLLNGSNGLDGSITFKVKSTTYAWSKDVTVGITFGGGNASKSTEISIGTDDYITHTVSFDVTPSNNYYGTIGFWIKNNASNESRTLVTYNGTNLGSLGSGITNYHTGGLCGIYPSASSLTVSLIGNDILFQQKETLGEETIDLNYYQNSPIFKAEIGHQNGYEKRTPSYNIAFYGYKVDGTKTNYPTIQKYSWAINKTNYTETISQSLPLFLKEGVNLDYPIRKYFLYYNGSTIGNSFYVTPFSFNLPNTVIAKQLTDSNYEAEVNLGNLNEWIDSNYNNLGLAFRVQNELGEVTKINNILVGKISTLVETDSNPLTYEIYKNNTLITSKEINTVFGLDFTCVDLSYSKTLQDKVFSSFTTLQQEERLNLSIELEENSGILGSGEEVKIVLMVYNEETGKNSEILQATEEWEQGQTKNITFSGITINDLIEINSNKKNNFYLKIISNDVEKMINLEWEILAYDYIKALVLEDKIEYELISGLEKKNGQCNIKEDSTLGISFLKDQFVDGLEIKIIFTNVPSYSFNYTSYSKEVDSDTLKTLLNNLSEAIAITPTQKNTKEIPYTIKYIYDNIEYTISTEEKLIITIPPLLIPTLAYRSKQVGINCEPSKESVLDIKAEQIIEKDDSGENVTKDFIKVRFQDKEGEETGYIDLQNGGLKNPDGKDFYLTQEVADDTYLKSTEAENTYLKKNDAENNYQKKITIENFQSSFTSKLGTLHSNKSNSNGHTTYSGSIQLSSSDYSNGLITQCSLSLKCKKSGTGTISASGASLFMLDIGEPRITKYEQNNGTITISYEGPMRTRTSNDNSSEFYVQLNAFYITLT